MEDKSIKTKSTYPYSVPAPSSEDEAKPDTTDATASPSDAPDNLLEDESVISAKKGEAQYGSTRDSDPTM